METGSDSNENLISRVLCFTGGWSDRVWAYFKKPESPRSMPTLKSIKLFYLWASLKAREIVWSARKLMKFNYCPIAFRNQPTSVPNPKPKRQNTEKMCTRKALRMREAKSHRVKIVVMISRCNTERHKKRKSQARGRREENYKSSNEGQNKTGDDLCAEIITHAFL